MAKNKPRKQTVRRLQLDLTPEANQRLEQLLAQTHCKSVPDLTRYAFSLVDWFVERRREGYELYLRKGTDELIKADMLRPVL